MKQRFVTCLAAMALFGSFVAGCRPGVAVAPRGTYDAGGDTKPADARAPTADARAVGVDAPVPISGGVSDAAPDTTVVVDTSAAEDESASTDTVAAPDAAPRQPAPPATWKEHWFEHDQLLSRFDYNDDVALYVDADVDRAHLAWVMPFATKLWQYTKQTYGDFGTENRIYWILHQGRYSGGHPSTYFDDSHDLRNVSDSGPGPWAEPTAFPVGETSHETGHVVEGGNNGVHGSPAFAIWQDSKWNEFYQYDAFTALGMTAEAQSVFTSFTNGTDNFPRAGTHWFRDWFYPLWRDHGHAQLMVKFFKLLALYFPKNGNAYARDMNWGEYVHFTSGAAGINLKAQATTAFGWPADRDLQFTKAQADFPMITY